jgi:hypothetical protein
MTAAALMSQLRARGVSLSSDGITLVIRPMRAVAPEEIAALRHHKAEILALLLVDTTGSVDTHAPSPPPAAGLDGLDQTTLDRPLGMPLDQYAREGAPLELRVPWSEATVFFVPDRRHAQALEAEGIGRERLWLAEELMALLAGPPVTHETLAVLTAMKRDFAGEVVANQLRGQVSSNADLAGSSSLPQPPVLKRVAAHTGQSGLLVTLEERP